MLLELGLQSFDTIILNRQVGFLHTHGKTVLTWQQTAAKSA